ncbi:hypothetical protein EV361DRAFT_827982, partial [Lentinula raphanica]
MISVCEASGDKEGLHFWTYILQALDHLSILGMSDEETGFDEDSGEPLKYVYTLPSRHPDFRPLFQYVDNIPDICPNFFSQTGPKRWKRI